MALIINKIYRVGCIMHEESNLVTTDIFKFNTWKVA